MKKFNSMDNFEKAINKIDKKKSLGKGILAQIEENKNLKVVTEKDFQEAMNLTFLKSRRPSSRIITMFTGEAGMFMFNWAVTFGENIKVKNYKQEFKRTKGMYFSLFTKQGKYKLYVLGTTFTVYEGTKVIKVFTDVQSSNLMDFRVFDKPQIHKEKMIKINNYLKNLENGSK